METSSLGVVGRLALSCCCPEASGLRSFQCDDVSASDNEQDQQEGDNGIELSAMTGFQHGRY